MSRSIFMENTAFRDFNRIITQERDSCVSCSS
jgi:hypothetical protein